jgi:uncharacterized membrane protein
LLLLVRRPGHYLVKGPAMAMVWPVDRVTDRLAQRMNAVVALGKGRTVAPVDHFSH